MITDCFFDELSVFAVATVTVFVKLIARDFIKVLIFLSKLSTTRLLNTVEMMIR